MIDAEKKKTLVTGGTGLVGSYLQQIMPDALYVGSEYNLTEKNVTNSLVGDIKHTTIIHLAAKAGGMYDNIKYPAFYYEENILINTNILKAATTHGVKRFVGVLSTCIYPDNVLEYPITEECLHDGKPYESIMGYSMAKRAMAVQIDCYNKQFHTNYQYLIPCNLYGQFPYTEDFEKLHFVNAMISRIMKALKNGEKEIILFGSGKPLRQFIWAMDFARAIKHVVENDIIENLNIAPDHSQTIAEIAQICLSACHAQDIKIKFDSSLPDGQYRKCASNKKMKNLLTNFSFTSLEVGIEKTFKEMTT